MGTASQSGPPLTSPVTKLAAVTPHDSNELTTYADSLYVGGAGNVVVIASGDSTAVTFAGAVAGSVLPVQAKVVKSTGTTATSIVALISG